MSMFPIGRITVPFRGTKFTVRELTVAEREEAKKHATDKGVPFIQQVVFQQTEWPEGMKPASVHALSDEPFELIEKLGEGIFGLSGLLTEEDPAKKAG